MMTKNAFIPAERNYSVNTYLWISLSHEGMSKVSGQAREQSEQAKQSAVERVSTVSHVSDVSKQT